MKAWPLLADPNAGWLQSLPAGGKTNKRRAGPFEYHLDMVGERSSGDEGELRNSLERGEVRIPE